MRPILQRGDAVVLDLCCGTGDLALAMTHNGQARVIGADFAHPMLLRAREKSAQRSAATGKTPLHFLEADALQLPFADGSFDAITTAFGFRNLANYRDGLLEIRRVLKVGGKIAVLEFTEPPDTLLGRVYRWYFREVLPRIGGLLSGHSAAYKYLPQSVSRFLHPEELSALMRAAGYRDVQHSAWTLSTVCLHVGTK